MWVKCVSKGHDAYDLGSRKNVNLVGVASSALDPHDIVA